MAHNHPINTGYVQEGERISGMDRLTAGPTNYPVDIYYHHPYPSPEGINIFVVNSPAGFCSINLKI
jgi:hypothetical protein